MNYKSCGNCALSDNGKCIVVPRLAYVECRKHYRWWQPIPCPLCGGTLSEVRESNGKKYRHCYSCHMETPAED